MLRRDGWICLAVTVLLSFEVLSAQSGEKQKALNITGTWRFEVTAGGTGGRPTVTFKQNGTEVTGRYQSEQWGDCELKGTLKGDVLLFTFTGKSRTGNPVMVNYQATVRSNDFMEGNLKWGRNASGTFTGKRM